MPSRKDATNTSRAQIQPTDERPLILVFDLGIAPYTSVLELQRALREAVAEGEHAGAVLLLEHEPVITLGTRGGAADLVYTDDSRLASLPVVKTERGGAATLHAPGQLVSYPILRIPGRDLRSFVNGLEQTLIDLLATYGIGADRREGAPGLYVRDTKIASVGLRCHRWVASHGTSLNVSVDLHLFDAIVSCGEAGLRQTSIAVEADIVPSMHEVKRRYVGAFSAVFGTSLAEIVGARPEEVMEILKLR